MSGLFEVEVQPLRERKPGPIGRLRRRAGRRVAAVALIAGVAVLVALTLVQLDPWRPPRLPDLIAFVGVDGSIGVVSPTGGSPVPLVTGGPKFQYPAWSPDGSRLAAIGTGSDGTAGLYVLDARRAAPDAAAHPPAPVYGPSTSTPIYAYWSPDGSLISFITGEPDGLALRVVPPDSPGQSTELRLGQPMYWQWIGRGRLIVHDGGGTPGDEVNEVPLASSTPQPVVGPIGAFQAPGVSATLGFRAYVQIGDNRPSLIVESRTGTGRTSFPVTGVTYLGWSPVGDLLAYAAPDASSSAAFGPLRLVDAASGTMRTLAEGLVVAFFWSPDARTVAVLDLVITNGQTAAATPSPAGTPSLRLRFVDVASGSVRSERDIRVPDNLITTFLPFFDQYALSHRLWSPAGDAIVLPLVDELDTPRITILPADGSASRVVADGVSAFWSP